MTSRNDYVGKLKARREPARYGAAHAHSKL